MKKVHSTKENSITQRSLRSTIVAAATRKPNPAKSELINCNRLGD